MRSIISFLTVLGSSLAPISAQASQVIDFDREIRPILVENCFQCHGPDAALREADLRLDSREQATADLGGVAAIVPGDPDASLLIERVGHVDVDERMPPAETGKTLSPEQIEALRRWIEQGAPWARHWSFVAPDRPELPKIGVGYDSWPRNPIDRFTLAAMIEQGLRPSAAAEPALWLRRVTQDLTGLPPSREELHAFLADDRENARERALDRLFASPRYGEHMAVAWLDVARYADTNGYHYDNERSMWHWRDWVVAAFNQNMPFDQFTIEQLAGDLLPEPSLEQRIATGFNRNHPINWEGGIIAEEYLNEYVVDRVDTTATVWMGLTMGCARCHDHKFDPITQRDYYRFYDFFNQVEEKGIDGLKGNAVPTLSVPNPEQEQELAALELRIAALEAERELPNPELDRAQESWQDEIFARDQRDWTVLEPFSFRALHGAELELLEDFSLLATGPHAAHEVYEVVTFTSAEAITAIRLEALADPSLPGGGPGRASHSNIVLSEFEVEIAPLRAPSERQRVELIGAVADHQQKNFAVSKAIDGRADTGWALQGANYGEDRLALFQPARPFGYVGGTALLIRIRHESNHAQHALGRFRLAISCSADAGLRPSSLETWQQLGPFVVGVGRAAMEMVFAPERAMHAGSSHEQGGLAWQGRDYADGVVHSFGDENPEGAMYLYRRIDAPSARSVYAMLGSDDGLKVWLNGRLVHESDAPRGAAADRDRVQLDLRAGSNELLLKIVDYGGESGFFFELRGDLDLGHPLAALAILHRPEAPRSGDQDASLRDLFRSQVSVAWRASHQQLQSLQAEQLELNETIPTTMVMAKRSEARSSHVLERGAYDRLGEEVTADVPSSLPAIGGHDRLALARWLVADEHPLTARVVVNRTWAQCLGRGLVATLADFGMQGARPSHPELLDWLAVEFREGGWDLQDLLRMIMTSATYGQSSAASAADHVRDPDNRWLARGARFRLTAEAIRDQALYASGLLVERLGGAPVKPYQPPGLWREVGSDVNDFTANRYEPSDGDDLYRRSLYTFRKRSAPPPNMALFDAPTHETCLVDRSRTNTPLQALVLWNDPTYVEAARALAALTLQEIRDDGDRLEDLFLRVLSRTPDPSEKSILRELLAAQRVAYAAAPAAALQLLEVGASPRPTDLDPIEHAAWTILASSLLNLDEAITRH